MYSETTGKIISILKGLATHISTEINETDRLEDIGIDSLVFVSLIVGIESVFEIEFDIDELDYREYPCLEIISNRVEEKIQTKKSLL